MKTKPEDSAVNFAVTSNVASARAAYETAVADVETGIKRRTVFEHELVKARAGVESVDHAPGNMELSRALRQGRHAKVSCPLEGARLRCQMQIVEGDFRKGLTWFEWGGELDREAVQRGDADANNLSTFVVDLRALTARTQEGGDFFAIMHAVTERIDSYRKAVARLTARRVAAHEPPPQSINGHAARRALLATARARNAGIDITPREVLLAGRGYSTPDDASITSVDEALDRFLRPQPPRKPTGKLEALRRELAALNSVAFDMNQEEQAALARAEEARRIWREEREEAKKREARDNAARAKDAAKKEAVARERAAKVAEFAAVMQRSVAEP